MQLVKTPTINSPIHAERLAYALWNLAKGTRFGLFLLGVGGDRTSVVGVVSPNRDLEMLAAQEIANDQGGEVRNGDMLWDELMAAHQFAVWRLVPTRRSMRNNSQSWGWQRADPLHTVFGQLADVPRGAVGGVAMSMIPIPGSDGVTALDMTVFAAGAFSGDDDAKRRSWLIASGYASGADITWPANQQRTYERSLRAEVSLLGCKLRRGGYMQMDEFSLFWHPPLLEEVSIR